MDRHNFDQAEVLILGRNKREKDIIWSRFEKICKSLGFSVRVTGGAFLTHSISCSGEDFNTVLCMVKGDY